MLCRPTPNEAIADSQNWAILDLTTKRSAWRYVIAKTCYWIDVKLKWLIPKKGRFKRHPVQVNMLHKLLSLRVFKILSPRGTWLVENKLIKPQRCWREALWTKIHVLEKQAFKMYLFWDERKLITVQIHRTSLVRLNLSKGKFLKIQFNTWLPPSIFSHQYISFVILTAI